MSDLSDISLHLTEELGKNIFNDDDVVIIFDHIKILTDLKLVATKIKLKGVSLIAAYQKEKLIIPLQKLVFELKGASNLGARD